MAKQLPIDQKFLRYMTRRDERVRQSHRILDGVVKKVADPFWRMYYPPNGWYCRCRVEKLQGSGITSTNTIGLNLHKAVPDIFAFNSYIERAVFSKKHPYYKTIKKHADLAKKNFNLPLP